MKAQLILENGKRFSAELFGEVKNVKGKVVFSTDMVGYQNILTDEKYVGKRISLNKQELWGYPELIQEHSQSS